MSAHHRGRRRHRETAHVNGVLPAIGFALFMSVGSSMKRRPLAKPRVRDLLRQLVAWRSALGQSGRAAEPIHRSHLLGSLALVSCPHATLRLVGSRRHSATLFIGPQATQSAGSQYFTSRTFRERASCCSPRSQAAGSRDRPGGEGCQSTVRHFTVKQRCTPKTLNVLRSVAARSYRVSLGRRIVCPRHRPVH